MARVMYIDGFAGAAGDMLLGAFIDAGVPVDALREALGSLGVGHELRVTRCVRAGVSATRVEVIEKDAEHGHAHAPGHDHLHDHGQGHAHSHGHRSLKEIAHLIDHSALAPASKTRAVELFRRLAEAEAAIHNMSVDDVHLHEVGAVDSIIDIVGAVFAFQWLGVDDIVAAPLNVGGGTIDIAHGTYPVPAPATTRLLTGVPIYSRGPRVELVTPTGALLVSGYARAYGPMPPMIIDRVGYGAGTRDLPGLPNVVRLVIGERLAASASAPGPSDHGPGAATTVVKIECEVDDMSPQLFEPASDKLFAAGALDVFLTAVQMKKGRPGTLITVIAPEDQRSAICDVLFRETTTIGVRFERMSREVLDRRWEEVSTAGGSVRIKVSGRHGETLNAVPEFEDCLRVANATGQPVKHVQAEAMRAWLDRIQ